MEKEKPEVINEELLTHVAGGVAGGLHDDCGSRDPGDDLTKILHVVGEDPHDLHADPGLGSVDQGNTVDRRSDRILRR